MSTDRAKFIVECSQQFVNQDSDGMVSASMGCFTGDCPHDHGNECVEALEEVYVAMAREIARLRFWNDQLAKIVPFERPAPLEPAPNPQPSNPKE